ARRAAGLLVLVALLTAPAATALLSQESLPGYEQGLYEVRVGRAASLTTLALVDSGGAVLVPLAPVLEMTGVPVQRSRGDSVVSLPHLGGGGRNTFDLGARRIRRPDRESRVGEREAAVLGGEVYLRAEHVAELLQASVAVDPGALTVGLARTPPFPVEQEEAARARRSRVAAAEPRTPPAVPYAARSGGGVLDWGITASGSDLLRGYNLRTQAGVALWGGDLAVGGTWVPGGGGGADVAEWSWSYRRGFPTSPLLRQVEVGDIVVGGALFRSVRGFSVTNARVVRDPFFSRVALTPQVPQGWEYEVYQNGELLGFSDALGRAPVSVPLRYGSTPVQVRMFSPAGEEVVSEVLYQVPPSQLAPGRVEYSAGAGVCPRNGCDYLAYGTVSAGLAHWLTLGAGAEATSDSLREAVLPHASLSTAWLSGWTAQLQAARSSYVRGHLGYYGDPRVNASLGGGINHPGAGQPSYIPTLAPRWYAESFLLLRFPSAVRSVGTEGRVEGPRGEPVDRLRALASVDVPRGTLEAGWEYDRARDGGRLTLSGLLLTPGTGAAWLRNRPLSAGVGLGGGGVELLQAGTSLQLGSTGYLVLSGRWETETRSPSLTLNYSVATHLGRAQARVAAVPGRGTLATAGMNGALSWDGRSGVVPHTYGGVRDAGVTGTVFYDLDGDGGFGPGDRPAANVEVLVGGHRVRTDAGGRYRSWNVVPYEVATVAVDTLRRMDPSWIPLTRGAYLRPTPHMYNEVDFPLVRTRELAGRLEPGEGIFAVGGVTLELREVESGRTESVVTFSDGEFYVSRVRPGEYELRVAPSSLQALRARAVPGTVRFRVAPAGDDLLVELEPIRLVREDGSDG
ncbi:MAG TPA: hypothetical protein VHG51_08765, partial [Longimicrobiaceae bacterium]|nr:hypothetical protein [Longimicrobiaceae bacterium]